MYRNMLNKSVEAPPPAVQVPLHVYGELRSRVRPARASQQTDMDGPPASFVLFHTELKCAAQTRGLLAGSRADLLWGAISEHVELPTVEDDEEP